jgi:hypothetical protein
MKGRSARKIVARLIDNASLFIVVVVVVVTYHKN